MTRRTPPPTAPLIAFLAAALAGCSGTRAAPDMVEVTGRVTVNGKPAEKVVMTLTPATPGEGREDECVVQGGEYRVKLIAAKYKVSFAPRTDGPPVPKPYRSPDTSGLDLDGTRSGSKNFDLK